MGTTSAVWMTRSFRRIYFWQKRGTPRWGFFVKAGASQPWYSPITLKINWARNGIELRVILGMRRESHGHSYAAVSFTTVPVSVGRAEPFVFIRMLSQAAVFHQSVGKHMAFFPIKESEVEALGFCASSRIVSAFLRFLR